MLLKKKQGSLCVIFYLVNGGSHMWSVYGLFQICAPESLQVRNCEVPGMKPASLTCRACTQPFALSLSSARFDFQTVLGLLLLLYLFSLLPSLLRPSGRLTPNSAPSVSLGLLVSGPLNQLEVGVEIAEKKEEVKLISPTKFPDLGHNSEHGVIFRSLVAIPVSKAWGKLLIFEKFNARNPGRWFQNWREGSNRQVREASVRVNVTVLTTADLYGYTWEGDRTSGNFHQKAGGWNESEREGET